jgi:hypothetical protein
MLSNGAAEIGGSVPPEELPPGTNFSYAFVLAPVVPRPPSPSSALTSAAQLDRHRHRLRLVEVDRVVVAVHHPQEREHHCCTVCCSIPVGSNLFIESRS